MAKSRVLSAEEASAAESLLGSAWGTRVAIRAAEKIWGRSHIVRLRLADDRSVVLKAIIDGKESFLEVTGRLGLPADGAGAEIDSLAELLRGDGRLTGLVHSDPCPDNTHMADGICRIFDFETSGWGPVALDAAYLLAPFPSCWCFASLPAEVARPALRAYRDQVTRAGIRLGPDWDAALTAALAGWVVARGAAIGRALDEDRDWGTTTARPRLLTWLRSFIGAAERSGVLPRLSLLAGALHERLSARWPDTVFPDYPAFARQGAPLAQIPPEWSAAEAALDAGDRRPAG